MNMRVLLYYLGIITLIAIAFGLSTSSTEAADINYSIQPGATESCVFGAGSSVFGSCPAIHDDTLSTAYGATAGTFGVMVRPVGYTATVNFSSLVPTITRVEVAGTIAGSIISCNTRVELFYAGSWNEVLNPCLGTTFVTGSWSGVSGIRIRAAVAGHCGGAFGCVIASLTQELRAFGPVVIPTCSGGQDIGIRLRESGATVKIAAETGAPTSKLRIRKSGTTYGIVLVDPPDPQASKMRIKTASGIKALCKLP